MNVPLSEAEANFAELIRRVEAGETVVLTRDGKAIAELRASAPAESPGEKARRNAGKYRGQVWIAEDFDELGPEWDEYVK